MKHFRIIKAIQWTGKNLEEIQKFCPTIIDMGFIPNDYNEIYAWPLCIYYPPKKEIFNIGDYVVQTYAEGFISLPAGLYEFYLQQQGQYK